MANLTCSSPAGISNWAPQAAAASSLSTSESDRRAPTFPLRWHFGEQFRTAVDHSSRHHRNATRFDFQTRWRSRSTPDFKLLETARGSGRHRNVVQSQKLADGEETVELPASVDFVSSPGSAYVKQLVKLRTSARARDAARSVIVVGAVLLREICWRSGSGRGAAADSRSQIDVLLVREGAEVPPDLAAVSRRIVRLGLAAMSKVSGVESPPEVVGVMKFPSTFCAVQSLAGPSDSAMDCSVAPVDRSWREFPRRILVLDRIQDPGNLGTLLRTVAAFSWDAVFLLPGCCDPFNDKALRAARGAGFHVPVASGEWPHVRDFAAAKNLRLYAGDPEPDSSGAPCNGGLVGSGGSALVRAGTALGNVEGLCLVLGSEGQGICEEVKRDCARIGIAMPGNFESLNVAVAGGILMFALS